MPPVTWTAERDQKLLLLLIEQINITGGVAAVAAAAWKTKYVDTGKDTYLPTPRAITEHIGQLQKTVGGKTAANNGTPKARATPKSTPRKPTTASTPKSSAKRKRTTKSSDDEEDAEMPDGEDDSEDEREMLKHTPSGPRSSLSRRSKSVAKTYNQDDKSSDELADQEEDARAATPTPTAGEDEVPDFFPGGAFDGVQEAAQGLSGVRMDGVVASALTPQGKGVGRSKLAGPATRRVVKREVRDDDSDGSEFRPEA